MTQKRERKPDNPEQSKRFVETAMEVEADQDREALDRALKKIDPAKHPPAKSRA
jgi:hypothetical protein